MIFACTLLSLISSRFAPIVAPSFAAVPPPPPSLARQLETIRTKVNTIEEDLATDRQAQKNIQFQLKKIQKLLQLQKLEQTLSQKRLLELERTVNELEIRRVKLQEKINLQQKAIRRYLIAVEASGRNEKVDFLDKSGDRIEAPRRRLLANLVDRGLKEIEILRADLMDAGHLEAEIREEKQQLTYLAQESKEQESVLELNQQLQYDILKRKRVEHHVQFENYRKLKSAEAQVEHLISEFNARKELERVEETEVLATRAMASGIFASLRGRLPYPVEGGRVIGGFGKSFDSHSGMHVFKKGIEIAVRKSSVVRAISEGKVAFSGNLPNYGQVVIVDHGNHYYSLCAHLDKILKKVNESVKAGDSVGVVGDSGNPLYFEIRSRNIAVNPLQWLFN